MKICGYTFSESMPKALITRGLPFSKVTSPYPGSTLFQLAVDGGILEIFSVDHEEEFLKSQTIKSLLPLKSERVDFSAPLYKGMRLAGIVQQKDLLNSPLKDEIKVKKESDLCAVVLECAEFEVLKQKFGQGNSFHWPQMTSGTEAHYMALNPACFDLIFIPMK
ncbi:MAG: hypothetical protein LW875_08045 [Proteobacteria bacterium]|jgi:hypothetical protein|nr:hypothetical protein [Pseudomonadota bacterium]